MKFEVFIALPFVNKRFPSLMENFIALRGKRSCDLTDTAADRDL